jgi:hypothetical protein
MAGQVEYPLTPRVPLPLNWQQFQHGCGLDAQGRLMQCKMGDRRFNVNTDGAPHVGLLPDFVEDMAVQYRNYYATLFRNHLGRETAEPAKLTAEDLKPLLTSADAYVRMWEHIDRLKPGGPSGQLVPAVGERRRTERIRVSPKTAELAVDNLVNVLWLSAADWNFANRSRFPFLHLCNVGPRASIDTPVFLEKSCVKAPKSFFPAKAGEVVVGEVPTPAGMRYALYRVVEITYDQFGPQGATIEVRYPLTVSP